MIINYNHRTLYKHKLIKSRTVSMNVRNIIIFKLVLFIVFANIEVQFVGCLWWLGVGGCWGGWWMRGAARRNHCHRRSRLEWLRYHHCYLRFGRCVLFYISPSKNESAISSFVFSHCTPPILILSKMWKRDCLNDEFYSSSRCTLKINSYHIIVK